MRIAVGIGIREKLVDDYVDGIREAADFRAARAARCRTVGDQLVGGIGAAGAPGGDLDDACARAGLDKIKDELK